MKAVAHRVQAVANKLRAGVVRRCGRLSGVRASEVKRFKTRTFQDFKIDLCGFFLIRLGHGFAQKVGDGLEAAAREKLEHALGTFRETLAHGRADTVACDRTACEALGDLRA